MCTKAILCQNKGLNYDGMEHFHDFVLILHILAFRLHYVVKISSLFKALLNSDPDNRSAEPFGL